MSQPPAGTASTVTISTDDGMIITVASSGPVTITPPPAPPPVTPPPSTVKTIFFDDFTGAAGSAPSSSNWGIDAGSDPTSTASHYVNSRSNVYVDGDSHLVIATTAGTGGYSMNSGRIATWNDIGENSIGSPLFSATWGTFSARILCTPVIGYWPAFWMYGTVKPWPAGGEVDILENFATGYGNPLNKVSAGIHGGTGSGSSERSLQGGYYTIPDSNYHTYSVIIPEDYSSVTFQVDGVTMAVNTPGYNPITEADWVSYATQGGGGGAVVGAGPAAWPFGPGYPYGIVLNVSTNAGGVGPVSPSTTQTILKADWVKVTQP